MTLVIVFDRGGIQRLSVEITEDDNLYGIKERLCPEDPMSVRLSFRGKVLRDITPIQVFGKTAVFIMENEIDFCEIEAHFPKSLEFYIERGRQKPVIKKEDKINDKKTVPSSTINSYLSSMPGSSQTEKKISGENFDANKKSSSYTNGVDQGTYHKEDRTKEFIRSLNTKTLKPNSKFLDKIPADLFVRDDTIYYIVRREKRWIIRNVKGLFLRYFSWDLFAEMLLFFYCILSRSYRLLCFCVAIKILASASFIVRMLFISRGIKPTWIRAIVMFVASLFCIDHTSYTFPSEHVHSNSNSSGNSSGARPDNNSVRRSDNDGFDLGGGIRVLAIE